MNDASTSRTDLAGALLEARDGARRLALPSAADAAFDVPAAYRIADEIRRRRIARGERPLGYKIGFTNRGIWPRYGVYGPMWGPVWDTTVTQLAGTEHTASLAGLVQPRLEPEIMFGLRQAPRAGMSAPELVDCIEWVAHGFEIVHTHFDDWRFQAADTVADFALHGRLLVGPKVPIDRFGEPQAELAALDVELSRDGSVVETGNASIVLDGPLDALRIWVEAMHAQPMRWPIVAGDIVSTGTITDAWPLEPGQTWQTRLSDPRLAGLTLKTEA